LQATIRECPRLYYADRMKDFLLLMHDDATDEGAWDAYIAKLRATGCFAGGSSIGQGACFSKASRPGAKAITKHLTGYLRVMAPSIEEASALLVGNPVYEAGGTVEIRELPRD
jgi:hypothetical protein